MFAVVRFLSDSSVDVVPSNWLNENECLWPSKFRASRAIKAVKLGESPDLTYTRHSIVILSKEDTLQKARSKLRKAEDTGNVATSTDQGAQFLLIAVILKKISEKGLGKRRRVVVSAAFPSDESDVEKGLQGAPPPPPPFGHEGSENITYFESSDHPTASSSVCPPSSSPPEKSRNTRNCAVHSLDESDHEERIGGASSPPFWHQSERGDYEAAGNFMVPPSSSPPDFSRLILR
ncbi:unnamed protein product [Ixodes persulcatus]